MQTRLVRMTEDAFQQLLKTATSDIEVDWGEPIETVAPVSFSAALGQRVLDGPSEPVYAPTITRHFRDDLDDTEVGNVWT